MRLWEASPLCLYLSTSAVRKQPESYTACLSMIEWSRRAGKFEMMVVDEMILRGAYSERMFLKKNCRRYPPVPYIVLNVLQEEQRKGGGRSLEGLTGGMAGRLDWRSGAGPWPSSQLLLGFKWLLARDMTVGGGWLLLQVSH